MKKIKLSPKFYRWLALFVISMAVLPVIVYLHLQLCYCLWICSSAAFETYLFFTLFGVSIYLYYSISHYIRKFYYNTLKWHPIVYNIVYYVLFTVFSRMERDNFLHKIATEENYLFTQTGAILAYVHKIFPLTILAHIAFILIRWAAVKGYKFARTKIIPSIKEKIKANTVENELG